MCPFLSWVRRSSRGKTFFKKFFPVELTLTNVFIGGKSGITKVVVNSCFTVYMRIFVLFKHVQLFFCV